ncbi:uncharacterized protein LOC114722609 [Neltuma alba]|uniref:uncharacterized protein LOC114722609 n=1 Tax=Neltuma alba TaxID=207710 RepID=UPI0010A39497|nr:uncharacterized protein LOC114722609 [Prosopis alba]
MVSSPQTIAWTRPLKVMAVAIFLRNQSATSREEDDPNSVENTASLHPVQLLPSRPSRIRRFLITVIEEEGEEGSRAEGKELGKKEKGISKLIWGQWNIRIIILFSLFLQIFLIVSAPYRKRIRGGFFIFFVWLAYLLADWAAGYCIGLISNNQEQKATLTQNDYLMAFWGPFLLLHLGGPDTITAFSLEDNELWLRHLLGLVFQSVTTAYVFLLTVPRNPLWLPTILMFVAGLIKYAERTHALYIAAINNFRKSLPPEQHGETTYEKLMDAYSYREAAGLPAETIMILEPGETGKDGSRNQETEGEKNEGVSAAVAPSKDGKEIAAIDICILELVQKAFSFFLKFQGLVVDMIYSIKDPYDSRRYFQSKSAEEALILIEVQLNFMYEAFYTKASVIRQYWFWFWGKFISLVSITATIVLFIKADRHSFDKLDVRVTYALLFGALFLDVMALFKRFFTDYTATLSDESLIDSYAASPYQKFRIRIFKCLNGIFLSRFLTLGNLTWPQIQKGPYEGCHRLSTKLLMRRWSESITGYNLLSYCVNESVQRDPDNLCLKIWVHAQDLFYQRDKRSNIKDLLDQWRYEFKNPFVKELWEYLFEKLKEKSASAQDIEAIQSICSARGEQVVQKANLETLKPFVDPNEVAFDQSLLLWHIATTLCSTKDKQEGGRKRQISMLVSDYMLYLLVMQPNMMSAIAGIGQKRFEDTCEEAKRFFKRRGIPAKGGAKGMLEEARKLLMNEPTEQQPIGVKGDRSKSLLFDACRLAKELNNLTDNEKWKTIASVWVELLSYAACHCRPAGHVQLLSKGGELISFVWLLMAQLGLSTQFQIKADPPNVIIG